MGIAVTRAQEQYQAARSVWDTVGMEQARLRLRVLRMRTINHKWIECMVHNVESGPWFMSHFDFFV